MAEIDTPNSIKSAVPEAQGHFDKGMEYLEAAKNLNFQYEDVINSLSPNPTFFAFAPNRIKDLPEATAEAMEALAEAMKASFDKAIQEFSEAVRLKPLFADTYVQRADALFDLISNNDYPISSSNVILPAERQASTSLGKMPCGKNRLLNR